MVHGPNLMVHLVLKDGGETTTWTPLDVSYYERFVEVHTHCCLQTHATSSTSLSYLAPQKYVKSWPKTFRKILHTLRVQAVRRKALGSDSELLCDSIIF